jgi:hypothetical protein
MRGVEERKVEILGEAVGLEKALLEARSSLELPRVAQLRMSGDSREHPAKDIVLLNDVRVEVNLRRDLDDFPAIDHGVRAQEFGTSSRHLDISFGQSASGSNLALPAVRRARLGSMSGSPFGWCSAM